MLKQYKGVVTIPCFVKIKPEHKQEYFNKYGLSDSLYYTVGRKGWDIKKDGSEICYINDLKIWISAEKLEILREINPN